MRIQRFTASELSEWSHGAEYASLPVVPISPQRALSYLHNPRMAPQDVVAYLGWEGTELIGFRTLVPDHLVQEEKLLRFAWLSGVWVHPEYRRQGIASQLLEAALEDWHHRLMTTNNAPASRAVYLKSGHFEVYHRQPGRRFYLRFSLHRLLPPKRRVFHQLKGLLKLLDLFLNLLHDRKLLIYRFWVSVRGIPYTAYATLPEIWAPLIGQYAPKTLSQRGSPELNWMSDYPWVLERKEDPKSEARYPFSAHAYPRKNWHIGLYGEEGNPKIWLELSLLGKVLTLPYYFGPQNLESTPVLAENLRTLLLHYMVMWKCDSLTVYHKPIVEQLQRVRGFFLHSREFEQVYLCTKEMKHHLPNPENIIFQDGEGDAGFTATG